MIIRPPTSSLHLRRLGVATTGLLLAGALFAPSVVLAWGIPPIAFPDNVTTNEDTAQSGNVLSNDWNISDSAMTVTGFVALNPTFGVIMIAANGNYTYVPAANWHGSTSTQYTAHNDEGNDTGTINITVSSVNDAPVAFDDTITAVEDTTTGNVSPAMRSNDTDVDGDTLTVTAVSNSTGGTATRTGGTGGTVTFAPTANLCGVGAGSFDYTLSDGHGGTDTGHVTVNITCVNDVPTANDDSVSVTEDTATDLTASILSNDTDIDLDTLVVSAVSNPAAGTVSLVGGVVTFTPTANLCGNGIGGFDYTADDGAGGSDGAHVIVTITCVNDDPVATNDNVTGTEDLDVHVTAFDMVGNDNDVDSGTLTVTGVSNATGGSASLSAGAVTFSPDANLCGVAAAGYDYTVSDGDGGSATGHVTIDLTCVNDNPLAGSDGFVTPEDTNLELVQADLLGNDSDIEGDTLSVSGVSNATGGSVELDGDDITFTPDADLCGNGAGGFDYTISDGNGGSDGAHVTIDITCVNDAPVATDDNASGTEDTEVVVPSADLTSNDTDTEGDTLTVTGVSNATGGSVGLDAGDVTFTPDEDLCGNNVAGYDYTVDDGNDGTDTGHVTIDLTCVNDNPVAANDTVTVDEDSADNDVTGDILDNDSDVDGDSLAVTDVSNATGGSVHLDAGVVTFTPDANGCGDGFGSFDYEISDGNGGTDTGHAEVNVTCDNDAPVANDDSADGTEDTDVVFNGDDLTGNDTDTENDTLTVETVANVTGGIAAVDSGVVTFTPDANLCGNNVGSFDYTVSDGNGGSDDAHVTIDLECVNDAPVGNPDSGMVDQATGPADYDVLANDTDVENDPLSLVDASVAGAQGTANVTGGGEVRFTPNPSFNGQAVITYTLSDGDLQAQGTLTVTVGPDVDAPVVARPTVAFGLGRVDQTAPIKIRWSAFDAGVGVASYDVQVSVAGGVFKPVYSGPATNVTKLYPFKKFLVWRVRATDSEGNTSGWKTSAKRRIVAYQNSNPKVKYTGAWARVITSAASGKGYEFTTNAGDRAKAKFKGRSVLYVAPKTKLSGWVKVYVDGALIGRYKLKHGTVVQGKIVARFTWAAKGKHRIRIVNDADGKWTSLDAFIVLK